MDNKITITNVSSNEIIIIARDANFRRVLPVGRVLKIDQDIFDELSFDRGFEVLVRNHYIKVDGPEEAKEVYNIQEPVYEASTIKKMLDDLDITTFAKFIPNATSAERETVVKYAVEKGITNNAIISLIKKYCDVDVIAAIAMKHDLES